MRDLAERKLTTLSGGELQRVQIAVGLAQEAPALIADEPTAHLDLGATAAVARLLRGLADDGLAVLLVVHDLALAAAVADRVVVLSRGRAVATGAPADVLDPDRLAEVWNVDAALESRGRPHRPPRRLAELEPAGGQMTTAVMLAVARRLPRERHAHHAPARPAESLRAQGVKLPGEGSSLPVTAGSVSRLRDARHGQAADAASAASAA